MKRSIFFHAFILTALVTFTSHAMDASPTFMQQLSSSAKKLTKLAKFAVMTSALLSPEIAGRSSTEPSYNLPLLYSTPFPMDKFSMSRALHPTKPQVALGGIGLISIVDINAADNPTMINIGENRFVDTLAYNPQGTLLAYGAQGEMGIIEDSTNKVIQTIDHEGTFVFNAEGNELIVQTYYNSSIWIWNLKDNTQMPINVTANTRGKEYISRLLRENTFVSSNPNGTATWNLEDPSSTINLPINSSYTTIFGDNQDEYFASYFWFSTGPNLIQIVSNNKSHFIPVGDKDSIIYTAGYNPKLKKYFFTITDFDVEYFELYAVDPQNCAVKQLLNLPQKNSSFMLNYARFNDVTSKLFAIADASNTTMQFTYIDLIELMDNSFKAN